MTEVESVISQQALNAIMCSGSVFKDLLCAPRQSFDQVLILAVGGRIQNAAQYEWVFRKVQQITRSTSGFNVSISVANDSHSGKVLGYVPYCRFSDPAALGEETIFAFYNKGVAGVSLVVIPDISFRPEAAQLICSMGRVQPFDVHCSWCGLAAQNLRSCPCKCSRYCGRDCQRAHWKCHKPQCSKSKSYVDIS